MTKEGDCIEFNPLLMGETKDVRPERIRAQKPKRSPLTLQDNQPLIPIDTIQGDIEAQCRQFGDMVMIALIKTMDHFVSPNHLAPIFKRKDHMVGEKKRIDITTKKPGFALLGSAFLSTSIHFDLMTKIFKKNISKGIGGSSTFGYKHPGSLSTSIGKDGTTVHDIINGPHFLPETSQFIAGVVKDCAQYHSRYKDDIYGKVEEIAAQNIRAAVQEVFYAPKPQLPSVNEDGGKHLAQSAFERDIRVLGDAIKLSMERSIEDLVQAGEKRPKVKTSYSFKGSSNSLTVKTSNFGMHWPDRDEFKISFLTRNDAEYSCDVERAFYDGGTHYQAGHILIPFIKEEATIASCLTEKVINDISAQIYEGIKENHTRLLNGKIKEAANLPKAIRSHLNHALAATFGGDMAMSASKPLDLTSFDKPAADEQFRAELIALKSAGKSDHYLLQTFGMAAGAKSGEDASVIAEWQIGRTLRLPATLDKIRNISDTLTKFVDIDITERARNAATLMSQMRVLQKTATQDLNALSIEAKSIHGAKTLMKAHEDILQKYVQGFHHRKEFLSETFGEASVIKKENALLTNLSAAQIHCGNQESIHERLTLDMMEQISDFSTNMAFLARSMQDIVTETTLQSLVREGQVIGDIDTATLTSLGLKPTDIAAHKAKSRLELENSIQQKIEDLRKSFTPLALATNKIERDLVTADAREIKMLPAPEPIEPPT